MNHHDKEAELIWEAFTAPEPVSETYDPNPDVDIAVGDQVKILRGSFRGKIGVVVDIDTDLDEDNFEYVYHVKVMRGGIRYLDRQDIALVQY